MPVHVIVAAIVVTGSLVLLVWSLTSASRPSSHDVVTRNLQTGLSDLRSLQLQKSAVDRAVLPAAKSLARKIRRITPLGWVEALERRIVVAGVAEKWPIERVLIVKILLAATGAVLGLLFLRGRNELASMILGVITGAFGYFLPDVLLWSKAKERQTAIQTELPDTLDQVTISVEAGLGFEAALERAARSGTGPLSAEFLRTLQEIKLGVPRSHAFRALADRTEVDELRRFVFAINQAEAYGMPIAAVLRVQAADQRLKRGQRAEERAMKIPVKILFPLIFCIFPVMFVVIIGPAAIQMARLFFQADL